MGVKELGLLVPVVAGGLYFGGVFNDTSSSNSSSASHAQATPPQASEPEPGDCLEVIGDAGQRMAGRVEGLEGGYSSAHQLAADTHAANLEMRRRGCLDPERASQFLAESGPARPGEPGGWGKAGTPASAR